MAAHSRTPKGALEPRTHKLALVNSPKNVKKFFKTDVLVEDWIFSFPEIFIAAIRGCEPRSAASRKT